MGKILLPNVHYQMLHVHIVLLLRLFIDGNESVHLLCIAVNNSNVYTCADPMALCTVRSTEWT